MARLLEGQLSASIFKAFKGKLLSGIIRRIGSPAPDPAGSSRLDGFGDIINPTATDTKLEGFTEGYSDFIRATAGIPDTDLQVNIFAQSMPGVTPAKDDLVRLDRKDTGSTWYQLRGAKIDSANVLWICAAFVIPAPVA